MNDDDGHTGRFWDAHAILSIAQVTEGLPFPSICREIAAFNFTHIVHAEDAARAVAWAETILTSHLGLTFTPKDTPRIGSAAHYILAAFMPSGLEVDIVAKAAHMQPLDAPQDAREMAEVA